MCSALHLLVAPRGFREETLSLCIYWTISHIFEISPSSESDQVFTKSHPFKKKLTLLKLTFRRESHFSQGSSNISYASSPPFAHFHILTSLIVNFCPSLLYTMEASFAVSSTAGTQSGELSGITRQPTFDISKLVKLPQFAGTMELGSNDVKSFCIALETKFPLILPQDDQSEAKKCQVTIACLTRLAQDWWANEVLPCLASGELKPFASFADLKEAMFQRFLPPAAYILYRDQLAMLRQDKRRVELYVGEFMALRHKCDDMSDGEALDRFMRGLDFRLRRQLCMFPGGIPTTLKEARERAILLNQAMSGGYFGTTVPKYQNYYEISSSSTPPIPAVSMSPSNGNEAMALDNLQYRQNRGIFRGKCYECQQYGHRAADCPNKNKGNGKGQ